MINIRHHPNTKILQLFFASATLVDFPQFRDIHHLIPHFLDVTANHAMDPRYYRIEDSDKWEIYVEYRKIVSRFFIDHIYSESWSPTYRPSFYWASPGSYPVGFFHRIHVGLAKYLLSLLSEDVW